MLPVLRLHLKNGAGIFFETDFIGVFLYFLRFILDLENLDFVAGNWGTGGLGEVGGWSFGIRGRVLGLEDLGTCFLCTPLTPYLYPGEARPNE